MSKKLCKYGVELNSGDLKLKYYCKKCGATSSKEKYCCKPLKLKKSA